MKKSILDKDNSIADLKTQTALLNQEKELLNTQVNNLKQKNLTLSDTTGF